jgi:chromosome segregation ATPase
MTNIQLERRPDRMQYRTADPLSTESMENVLAFRRDEVNSQKDQGAAAIEMVCRAAGLMREVEQRASDIESRAKTLAKRAIEKLELAEERVDSAVRERQAAQDATNETNLRLHEAEIALENAESRIASYEAKVSAAEERADAVEMRAREARAALVRIESAIRTHLLGVGRLPSENLAAAA